ncbi:hypothetical protein LSTR_LSTR000338 [Laodelphax striatellus]|uniref:PWWP domain-containing protein n=1 Tax=Laodelphax striatellus TaxID=195883 RepID=A0A482X763_LAOST|nr:hypothetical protein LSTR_LSTR000338 [Laodelphax striatellus]
MAKRYGPGDKVFAKVRGYPPWPARVEGVADETPNKMKYHVYFYGTCETAICKTEELFSYIDNREKFGKPMKKRGFKEGIEQIEQELGLTPKARPANANANSSSVSITPSENDSDLEGNLVIDEAPHGSSAQKKTPKAGSNTTVSPKVSTPKASKRKAEVDKSEEPEAKKQMQSPRKQVDTTPSAAEGASSQESDSKADSSMKSRSGRIIKQKKFADQKGDADSSTTEEESSKATNETPKEGEQEMICSVESSNENVVTAKTPAGQEVKIDLNENKPAFFKSDKARLQWHADSLKKALALKTKIESGEIIPKNIKNEMEEIHMSRDKVFEEMGKANVVEDKEFKLNYLRVEAQLLDIDLNIRGSLNLINADPDACLRLLDDLMEIQLTPLMLKKHPECVETIKKLRKYIGNTARWNMDEEAVKTFEMKASMIRVKAEHVYNKLKAMFTLPEGKSFREAFADELAVFSRLTENLTVEEIFRITKDPIESAKEKSTPADDEVESLKK